MELSINNESYEIGRLNAMMQFHVARRLAPALTALGSAAIGIIKNGGALTDAAAVAALGPVIEVVSQMSDADSEYVINTCLSVVRRRSGDGWAAIRNGSQLMFQDIDMSIMLRLAFAVIKENLANFIPALPDEITSNLTPSA